MGRRALSVHGIAGITHPVKQSDWNPPPLTFSCSQEWLLDLDLDHDFDLHSAGKAGRDDALSSLVMEGSDAVGAGLQLGQGHLGDTAISGYSALLCASRQAAESGVKRGAPNSATPNSAIFAWVGSEISQSMNWFASSLLICGLLSGLTAMTP